MIDRSQKTIRYSGIQPQYFPRLHYFARIFNADIFVIRDDCQYVNSHKFPNGTKGKSYQSHTPIKQHQGISLLTIPVIHDGLQPLSETKIQYNESWSRKHIKTFETCYSKAKYFAQVDKEISQILTKEYKSLADLNIATICWGILKILGEDIDFNNLNLEFVVEKLSNDKGIRLKSIKKASTIKSLANKSLSANEKIIEICKDISANEDYSGGTAVSAYIDHKFFEDKGVKITVQDWKCKPYTQMFTKQQVFIPNLSIVDLMMNVSIEEVQEIIRG